MTYAVAEVITAISTAFLALSTTPDWRANTTPYDLLPGTPDAWEHRSFSIAAPSTSWEGNESSRVQRSAGLVHTTIGVRWMFRVRGDAVAADYLLALTAEAELIGALTAITGVPMRIHLDSESRVYAGDGSRILGQINLTVAHHHPVG